MNKLTTFENKECRRVRGLLDDFLSDELTIETNRQILFHIENCEACLREKEWRETSRKALIVGWKSQGLPPELAHKVRGAVGKSRALNSFYWMAAAWLIPILSVFIYFVAIDQGELRAVSHSGLAAADHLECSGHPARDVPLPLDPSLSEVSRILEETMAGFQLVQIAECEVEGAHFTHYTFEGASGNLSLLVEARQEGETLKSTPAEIMRDGMRIQISREGPVAVASLEGTEYFIYLVSDHFDSHTTLTVTERLLPPLKKVLLRSG